MESKSAAILIIVLILVVLIIVFIGYSYYPSSENCESKHCVDAQTAQHNASSLSNIHGSKMEKASPDVWQAWKAKRSSQQASATP